MNAASAAARSLAAGAVLLLASATLAAQSAYVIVDSVRLPAESYVGDHVELRYTVRTQADPAAPEQVPQPRWGEITSLRIVPAAGQFDLRMTVVPYEPGTLTLPNIDLGELRIDGLNLLVSSILPEDDVSLRPAHGPQRLPGTRASMLLAAFAASLAIAVTLYLSGPGRKHLRVLAHRYRARLPYRRLISYLQALGRDISRYSVREFYIGLVEHLQAFMSNRVSRECRAATSTELIALLPELETACGAAPGTASALVEVLEAADEAKFARRSVRRKKRTGHLDVVTQVVTSLESCRRRAGRTSRRRRLRVGA